MNQVARRALTPRDTTQWQLPRDPQLSPDGRRPAFVVESYSRPGEHDLSAVWMLDVTAGETHLFTQGPRADSSPRWSSDGSQLDFLSDREEAGTKQLYLIAARGGEARLLGPRGMIHVSAFDWFPDGSIHALLFPPTGFSEGKRYPMVVHVLGGPAWLWSDRFLADWHDWAQLLAQGVSSSFFRTRAVAPGGG